MRTIIVISVVLAFVAAEILKNEENPLSQEFTVAAEILKYEENPLSQEFIDHINNVGQPHWKAGQNFHPHEWDKVKAMSACVAEGEDEYIRENIQEVKEDDEDTKGLPKFFDARNKWWQCKSLGEIRDQGACGSCWVFCTAAAISDRMCIADKPVRISAEDINSCCRWCGNGCKGGHPVKVWKYWTKRGFVSGGPYDSYEGCMPYTIPPSGSASIESPTPTCTKKCIKCYKKTYQQDKRRGRNVYRIKGVGRIMREIANNGPVTANFAVYSDFYNYKSGVYHKTCGKKIKGLHCVKLIGYGTECGVDYWLAANSWNATWGDLGGFFKIRRGTNECGIESNVLGGKA